MCLSIESTVCRRFTDLPLRLASRSAFGDALGERPEDGLAAAYGYALYLKVKSVVGMEKELVPPQLEMERALNR